MKKISLKTFRIFVTKITESDKNLIAIDDDKRTILISIFSPIGLKRNFEFSQYSTAYDILKFIENINMYENANKKYSEIVEKNETKLTFSDLLYDEYWTYKKLAEISKKIEDVNFIDNNDFQEENEIEEINTDFRFGFVIDKNTFEKVINDTVCSMFDENIHAYLNYNIQERKACITVKNKNETFCKVVVNLNDVSESLKIAINDLNYVQRRYNTINDKGFEFLKKLSFMLNETKKVEHVLDNPINEDNAFDYIYQFSKNINENMKKENLDIISNIGETADDHPYMYIDVDKEKYPDLKPYEYIANPFMWNDLSGCEIQIKKWKQVYFLVNNSETENSKRFFLALEKSVIKCKEKKIKTIQEKMEERKNGRNS